MPLNATAIKNFKHSGKPTGDKYSDGEGMYTVAVKVIDIFGNDTMTLVPVNVG